MKYSDVKNIKKKYDIFIAETSNGDQYKAILASEGARGCKWNFAYIDENIDEEIIWNIIYPCCLSGDLKNTIEWYGFEESKR